MWNYLHLPFWKNYLTIVFSYLVLQNKLFQNLVAENKNNYLTFSMGRCLAGQLWLGASNEVVAKTSAGLQLSEGLFVLEDLLTK